MPRITIRGLTVEQICEMSEPLTRKLADICQCGEDNFTYECVNFISIFEGKVTDSYPFIEVAWFERGTEVRNQFAQAVTESVRTFGYEEIEVAFTTYTQESYYINGQPQA
ncbi:DUF1904 family protein [Paenibacillus hexagrammi]|uniref:DUF1904 domain-containing protein n=1 Tax=Paenibacillus hexagrammi TaxID=2908839 RepID=A0ABY3SN78_9BACL|nr:DUF1904 family protein [Paenibacillus sp. YPD9-1]UJF34671.1 DUF1904 domain-containing protein [Paenibacillus sp. YPD9-1]